MAHLCLLLATILLIFTTTLTMSSPILDADGNPLEAGSKYFILPATTGLPYGGLNLSPKPGTTCPNYAGQYTSSNKQGRPVVISPASDPTQGIITEGSDVTITFVMSYKTKCKNTGEWQVVLDPYTRGFLVKVGQEHGTTITTATQYGPAEIENVLLRSLETVTTTTQYDHMVRGEGSLFKLERMGGADDRVNKILYCLGNGDCGQVGDVMAGVPGLKILGLVPVENSLPFDGFVFKKASSLNKNYYY